MQAGPAQDYGYIVLPTTSRIYSGDDIPPSPDDCESELWLNGAMAEQQNAV
jgi:hypothetical protein